MAAGARLPPRSCVLNAKGAPVLPSSGRQTSARCANRRHSPTLRQAASMRLVVTMQQKALSYVECENTDDRRCDVRRVDGRVRLRRRAGATGTYSASCLNPSSRHVSPRGCPWNVYRSCGRPVARRRAGHDARRRRREQSVAWRGTGNFDRGPAPVTHRWMIWQSVESSNRRPVSWGRATSAP